MYFYVADVVDMDMVLELAWFCACDDWTWLRMDVKNIFAAFLE